MKFTAGLAMFAAFMVARPAFAEPAAGNWTGAIDGHLVSFVHLESAADGTFTATFASHDIPQSEADFRSVISSVTASADQLTAKCLQTAAYLTVAGTLPRKHGLAPSNGVKAERRDENREAKLTISPFFCSAVSKTLGNIAPGPLFPSIT